jgi:predicted aspartyl protease
MTGPGAAAWLAAVVAISGCSIHSRAISRSSERFLKANEVAAESLRFRVLPGGKRYAMQLFHANLPPEPVTVPMVRGVSHLPAVSVRLNDSAPIPMIVDSGAQLSVVEASRALAAKAGVFMPGNGVLRITGVGGDERAWLARFQSARIGPMEFTGFVTVLRRETSQVRFGGFPLGRIEVNLIGAPVLTAFSFVTFDYPSARMVFSGGGGFAPSSGALRIPMTVRDSLPYVMLRIGGHVIPALVDTGARDEIFLSDEIVRKWGLESNASEGGTFKAAGLGGMIAGRQFRLPLVHMGEVPVRNVVVDCGSGPWPARIGTELLERWRVTFDFRGRALWLESPSP